MFNIGAPELMIIVIVALVLIGPKKLPEIMRALGRGLAELRRTSEDVKDSIQRQVTMEEQKLREEEKPTPPPRPAGYGDNRGAAPADPPSDTAPTETPKAG